MAWRKLKGTKLFDGYRLLENHLLAINEEGMVEGVFPLQEGEENVELHEGILLPGFINCHCHIELSHLKNCIPPGTGLVDFIISVVTKRESITADKHQCIKEADAEMYQNGIAAVGDICNTRDAIDLKKGSKLQWHSFIEVINFYDAGLQKQLAQYSAVLEEHLQHHLNGTLTPHAPYSVSAATFDELNKQTGSKIISVHNQETGAEDELFKSGGGDFLKVFTQFGNGTSPFLVSGKSSLQTWLPHFTGGQTILLVHNTFISEDDIVFAKQHAAAYGLKIVYCLCPNANLYIENALPPVDLLVKHACTIVLGTDSYSSNRQLSIGKELETIKKNFSRISLEEALQWATINGAEALGLSAMLGSFKQGKKPGVILLNEQDYSVHRII